MDEYILGVDVGGTKIAVCSETISGTIGDLMLFPSRTSHDYEASLSSILNAIDTYISQKANGQPPSVIGFGLKDAVDYENGIWLDCPSTPGFRPMNLRRIVKERYGAFAVMDNDVHVAALAEIAYGAGQKYSDFLYINIGTGISIGAIVSRKLLRGISNYAGEAGHLSTDPNGKICPLCGQPGCLENQASGSAIISQAMEVVLQHPSGNLAQRYYQNKMLTSSDVFELAAASDPHAYQIAQGVIASLKIAIRGLIHIFNPQAIVFGGGVVINPWLITQLQEEIPQCLLPASRNALTEIAPSRLGVDQVGILGALSIAKHHVL